MSSISIIGTGNMARTIGELAVAGGNTVEVMGRDQSKAADLAKALGGGAAAGEWGAVPAGDIVIVAVLYDSVVPVVAEYGEALAGKAIVDIVRQPDIQDKFRAIGFEPTGLGVTAFSAFHDAEVKRWVAFMTETGLRK